jgi:cytidylate kinase
MLDSAAPLPAASVITIDGPTASGKGTIALRVAQSLQWHYLDSGALYRLVALASIQAGLFKSSDGLAFAAGQPPAASLTEALTQQAMRLDAAFSEGQVRLAGADVSEAIRTEEVGMKASQLAALPAVRAALVERQRAFRQPPGLVADGRDMGTVIFPDAFLKIYLTASAESRAWRRYKQLIDKAIPANFEGLLKDLTDRDARDAARSTAPLKPAPDAVLIDSTVLDVDATVAAVLFHLPPTLNQQ